jgi:hypothetical protein
MGVGVFGGIFLLGLIFWLFVVFCSAWPLGRRLSSIELDSGWDIPLQKYYENTREIA